MATADPPAALRRRKKSIRNQFVAVAAALFVPGLLLSGWWAYHGARAQIDQVKHRAAEDASEIAAIVDRELTNATNILTALSGSYLLQVGDLQAFHKEASDVARRLDVRISLRDAHTGDPLFNTAASWEANLPSVMSEGRARLEQEVVRTENAAISNVFFSMITSQYAVAVGLPILRQDTPTYTLTIGIPVDIFARALKRRQTAPGWIVSIVDLNGTVVARLPGHEQFVGKKAEIGTGNRDSFDGVGFRELDRGGVEYYWTSHQSEVAGWKIVVSIPGEAIDAPVGRALTTYVAAGGALLVVALALSFFAGGRVEQSTGMLGIDRQPTREELNVLFNTAMVGMLVIDKNGVVALGSSRLESMFGYGSGELTGEPADNLFSERFDFTRPRPMSDMEEGRPVLGRRKDGSTFSIEIGFNSLTVGSSDFIRAAVVDITSRKLAEKHLSRALAERDQMRRRLMQAQEDERLRLARDLHDQTGQSLAAAMMDLKALEPLIVETGRERVRGIQRQFEMIGQALHRVAWELRPAAIDELGLSSALASYVEEWSDQFGIAADFHSRDTKLDLLPVDVRTALYRLVQEGLTNIAKHAQGATSVSVVIDRLGATLRLTIEDDGPGFDIAAQRVGARNAGLGIAGMRERLALLGGTLEIESTVGHGTTIFFRIPIEAERLIA
jgi:two-component system, NarL family, sensor histidine kinase UhpB